MTQNTLQSSYSRYMSVGANGAPASMTGWDADTKICESASIGFGLAVSKGDADNGVTLGGTLFSGVSYRDITLVHTTADQYEEGDNMGVAIEGDLWVVTEDAVEAQQEVKYNTSTGQLGSDGGTLIVGAVWKTGAGAGELAIVRLSGAVDVTT